MRKFVIICCFLVSTGTVSWGLAYCPEDYNNLPDVWEEGPDGQCMARIAAYSGSLKYATAAIIAPNFIMTAYHWGSLCGHKVSIGTEDSDNYIIVDERGGSDTDLRVYRVKKVDPNDPNKEYALLDDANFSDWVDLYSRSDELGKLIITGSYARQGVCCPLEIKVLPGTLHRGRNVVSVVSTGSIANDSNWTCEGDRLKYKVRAIDGDSGAGWFIRDGIEWKMASQYYNPVCGPRISSNINWIDKQITAMGGSRPLPDVAADIHWEGSSGNDWFDANSWDTNNVPSSSDRVGIDNGTNVVISSGQAEAKELFVGIDNGGSVSQNGATTTIEQYLYVGGRVDCNSSSYTISGGELTAKGIVVGNNGRGLLDINDSSSEITVSGLLLGENGELEAEPNSTIQLVVSDGPNYYTIDGRFDYRIDGRFDIEPNAVANNLAGLGNLTIVCGFNDGQAYDPNIIVALEVAGADSNTVGESDFGTANFVVDKLVVGRDVNEVSDVAGRIFVGLVDRYCNQAGSSSDTPEALYVNTLKLKAGATFGRLDHYTDYPPLNLYYKNGGGPKLFLMGDVNLDGAVDQNDLDIWSANENKTGAQWADGDMNGDRVVDDNDRLVIEKVFKSARNPLPAFGSTVGGYMTIQLKWDAAVDAISHDVYIGTDYDSVANANESSPEFRGNQVGTTFELYSPGVETYHWRIDEVYPNDVIKGYMWWFTHMPEDRVYNVATGVYYDYIQEAIDSANPGNVIEVAEGIYYEGINFNGRVIMLRSTDPNDWDVVAATVIDGGVSFVSGEDTNSVLSGFTIDGGYFGILLEYSSPTIKHNRIMGAYHGIWCRYSEAADIVNNWIYDCVYGISFDNVNSAVLVRNNTIVNNYGGIQSYGGVEPNIVNCILWDNGDDLNNCTATYSCIEGVSDANGIGNISSDPLFVDRNNDDYHLSPNSPCIDVGCPNGNYGGETDIDGQPRIQGIYVDIGADEAGSAYSGCGIYIPSGSPVITNCKITDNSCGIWSRSSEAVIKNNWICNNDSAMVFRYAVASATVRNNTVADNWDYGIYVIGDNKPEVTNCILWGNWDDSYGGSVTYSCIADVNDANGTGNIDSDPCFVSTFDFLDGTDANGTATTILIADASLHKVNDVIEYDNDGIARTVTDVNIAIDIITFANDPLDANSVWGIRIHNWGPNVTDVNEDYHLHTNSLCIDAGDPNGTYTGELDIDFAVRVLDGDNDANSIIDMGADEYDPN